MNVAIEKMSEVRHNEDEFRSSVNMTQGRFNEMVRNQ